MNTSMNKELTTLLQAYIDVLSIKEHKPYPVRKQELITYLEDNKQELIDDGTLVVNTETLYRGCHKVLTEQDISWTRVKDIALDFCSSKSRCRDTGKYRGSVFYTTDAVVTLPVPPAMLTNARAYDEVIILPSELGNLNVRELSDDTIWEKLHMFEIEDNRLPRECLSCPMRLDCSSCEYFIEHHQEEESDDSYVEYIIQQLEDELY